MSCEGHRDKFFDLVSNEERVQKTFGGTPADAKAVMDQAFMVARAQMPKKPSGDQLRQAEAGCRALFAQFTAAGIKPPTHSPTGLPRRDAMFGYAAVYRALEAARQNKPLPALAQAILTQRGSTRAWSAVGEDPKGYYRCSSCGRFASHTKGHNCPITATRDSLNRALVRRLGVPESAFGSGNALDALLADARTTGIVTMRHNLTGEYIHSTLDGLPLALATGFVPDAWRGQEVPVELTDGRIVSVLDATGLTPVLHPAGAVAAASAAYGLALKPDTPIVSATALPPVSYRHVRESATTGVAGGQPYDLGHFLGTEYRKGGSHGAQVAVYGVNYTIGQRSQDNADWSSARISGSEPPPRGGVAVGRNLVEAMKILSTGEVVETADGIVQVYDPGRRSLLAVYDPQANIAGDTAGNPNASAAQMAAIIAQRALHPQNQFDAALATDLVRMHEGAGTPLAAADSAYIAIKNGILSNGQTITLGASVGTQRCAQCGQFMGDAHVCPGSAAAPDVAPGEIPTILVQPQVDVKVDAVMDTAQIAEALQEAQPSQVSVAFDAQEFAQALRTEIAALNPGNRGLDELRQAITQMAGAVETLAKAQSVQPGARDQALQGSVDRLTAVLEERGTPVAVAAPTGPAPEPQARPAHHPRSGRERPDDLPLTPQEQIFSPIRMPAPDPYLTNVPAVVGGQLYQPLEEHIPALDPNFEINTQAERIMRTMSALLQVGAGKPKNAWSRSFGIYGPPGTGKNTLARQLAASIRTVDENGKVTQGMNYVEANITPESSMQELIGTTVLSTDPQTGTTVSRAQLGKIGLAAAMGSVICINEIVRNPKLATALQSMIEDGEIQIDSPEQGLIRVPVHPSTVFVCTWNPGYEGDTDRPGAAPLSRMIPMRLDQPSPEEQARRVDAFFASLRGDATAGDENELRRQEIIAQDYAVPADITPTRQEVTTAVRFFNEIAMLAGGGIGERQIGLNSETSTAPGPRQLNRYIALGKAIGWDAALDTLKICCDQDEQFRDQWRLIEERFEAHYGTDGEALQRSMEGKAPLQS